MDSLTLMTHLRNLALWPEEEAVQHQILELSKRFPDGRSLARELIQLNLLTPYQANQILTAKGQTLVAGPYRILERLGEGGMGQVFKARHYRLHRVVALKIIRPERVSSNNAVGRFLREVASVASLSHPNCVRAYDADQLDDTYYFAMQYVHGTDLSRLVKQNGPLAVEQACDYAYQAAAGLQHIHERGLVHRDIKPSNLMITATPEGGPRPDASSGSLVGVANQVKILDLGVARLCEDQPDGTPKRLALTQLGVVMGTADYMAPEQARDSREADGRSDIYSLGCTLYFALTGQPPFPGGNAIEKMLHHQLDEPTPLDILRPDVPPELAAVMRRMMAKKPAERYQHAGEVLEALGSFCFPALEVEGVVAPAPSANGAAEAALVPVVLRADAIPHRGAAAFNPWIWVAAASAFTCGAVMVILLLRILSR